MKTSTFLLAVLVTSTPAFAGSRTSANYSIATDTADAGGLRATSARYTNDGSAGGFAGVSTVAAPAKTAKAGYIAQLYEVTGFLVSASPSTLNEGTTRQLDAGHLLDDATLLAIDPSLVSWSVLSGPIVSISTTGLATAGIVYQHTAASVRGTYLGDLSPFNLTVLNAGLDDFESYAGDGIDDDWQVLYFGLPPNPLAGPLLDPDGDGQSNVFEWIAGLVPTDPHSVFKLRIEASFQGRHLVFSPLVGGRTYTVLFSPSLLAPPRWPELPPGLPTFDTGSERTVIDTGALAVPRRYYRVEITK